jgi:hypothetical protein
VLPACGATACSGFYPIGENAKGVAEKQRQTIHKQNDIGVAIWPLPIPWQSLLSLEAGFITCRRYGQFGGSLSRTFQCADQCLGIGLTQLQALLLFDNFAVFSTAALNTKALMLGSSNKSAA